MGKTINARLDEESLALLRKLRKRTGKRDSEIVRDGLRVLFLLTPREAHEKIIGQGAFESGVGDLGSNRDHLDGFGR